MDATLEAVKRNTFGRNEAGRMRRAGQIPAVMYGGGGEGVSIAVDPKSLLRILHSKSGVNTLISLKLEGAGDTRVLVKEYQLEPIAHRLLHADFYKVAMDKALRVTVPVHLAGEAQGVKVQGGVAAAGVAAAAPAEPEVMKKGKPEKDDDKKDKKDEKKK